MSFLNEMLASHNRLNKGRDFEKVKSEGRLFQSDNFGVVVLKKETDDHSRFAFVVSTKISNQAVQRNRIARALRESVRQNLYLVAKGYDMIFLPKTAISRKITDEIMSEARDFLVKNFKK